MDRTSAASSRCKSWRLSITTSDSNAYARAYLDDYAFEAALVRMRHQITAEWLATLRASVVVEVGCGHDLLVESVSRDLYDKWTIVEPAEQFVAHAKERLTTRTDINVIQGRFEDVWETDEVRSRPPTVVLLSSLLHEVDPAPLLNAARALLLPTAGLTYISVPNAFSLHRRLARAMGLISDEHALSGRNVALGQSQPFTIQSLTALVEASGFVALEQGGYFLKPFTHSQMDALPFLDEKMLKGLLRIGQELPELASEISLVARPQ